MHVLESRRRAPRPDRARRAGWLTAGALFARRRWPLVWAALHLLGCAAGEWWANRGLPPAAPRRPPADLGVRLGTLAPALLGLTRPGPADVLAWGAAGASAALWARAEAGARRSRPEAAAARPWTPSRRRAWRAAALVRVTGWPDADAGAWSAPACLVALGSRLEGDAIPPPRPGDSVLLRGDGPPPAWGALLAGVVEAGPAAGASTAGGFAMARFLAGRGVLWQGRWETATSPRAGPPGGWSIPGAAGLARLRAAVLARLARGLPPREAALLGGVLLGERDASSRANQAPFTRVGLAHLFAVSGLNVGIILGVLFTLARPLRPGPAARAAAALVLLPAYAVLTGLTGSVLRACALGALALAGRLAGRRLDALHLLGVLLWLTLQAQPCQALDIGCRLSYLAAAGLLVFVRGSGPLWRRAPARWRWLPLGLAVTLGSQWFTLPDTAASFGWIHPLSPLVNLYAVPLFTGIVWLASLALLADPLCRWAGECLFAVCWALARLFEVSTAWLDAAAPIAVGIPALGPARLGGILAASALLGSGLESLRRGGRGARLPLPAGAALLAGLLPLGRAAPRGAMTVQVFAVGQGDCALFVFPDRSAVAVDAGPALRSGTAWERTVAPWLDREGLRRLDGVVVSHAHDDHTGGPRGGPVLTARRRVGTWWLGGAAAPELLGLPTGAATRRLAAGDTLRRVGPWALVCVHPGPAAPPPANENDASAVVALLRRGRAVALFSGDLERGGERALLEGWRDLGPLHVWKAGHHGSRTSGDPALLAAARPGLVVVSCGVANRHRHPSHGPFLAGPDTLRLLRTDLDGTVRLRWRADGALDWRDARGRAGRLPPLP